MHQKEADRGRSTSGVAVFMGKKAFSHKTALSSKGQVTIFIILGLLLLLALLLVIFFRKGAFEFKPSELIPTEKGRIERLITNCIEGLGDEALSLLAAQGGYIEVPTDIKNDAALHLALSPFLVVPYWAYGTNTRIPSLYEMKLQIDRHLEENLAACALSQELFRTSYDVRQKAPPDADTEITDKKVLFNVRWNIEVRDPEGEVIAEVLQHQAESTVKLKRVHETARKLVERELKTLKLEDITQDLIALEHPSVPVAGIEFSCGQKRWLVEDVKRGLQDLLRINLRELRVSGTDIIEFPEELPYYQHHYVFDMGADDTGREFEQDDVSVLFSYENTFPMAIEVSPASGRYLKSNQMLSGGGNELLSAICIQTWKFVYDVSYPVLVAVTDETTGYSFRTAFTVHLQKNIPDRSAVPRRDATAYFDAFTDEEFCLERRIPMTVSTYEVISDRASGVFVKEPLEDVELTFTCLKYSCSSGTTEYDFAGMGDVAAYSTNFPYCVGGILRGVKEEYKDDWERVVTEAGKEIELELTPLHEIPISSMRVLKHTGTAREPLQDDETALITLKHWRERDDAAAAVSRQLFHEETVVISPSLEQRITEEETLAFLAGADFTYELDIQVLSGSDGGSWSGGYHRNWTVSWDELQAADEVTFHVVGSGRASEEEIFELLAALPARSSEVPLPELR